MNKFNIARHALLASVAAFEAPVDNANAVPDYDGNAASKAAIAMAAKESADMSAAMTAVVKAKEDWQGGPFKVLRALGETYGDDLDAWPTPGSDTGSNRDVISVDVTDGNGMTKPKKTTWYAVFADNTKEGKAVLEGLEHIERAGKVDAIKDGIPADILEMTPHQRVNHKNFLLGRRSTIRGSYKRAMQLHFQFAAVNDLAEVTANPIWQNEVGGDVVNTTKPIQVFVPATDGGFPKHYEVMGVANFLKLDAKKASEKGGTFKALMATLERGTKSTTGNTAVDKLVIKTVPTFIEVLATMHGYLDTVVGDRTQADMGAIVKLFNTKDSDELMTAVVETRNALNDMIEAGGLEAKYSKAQQRIAKQTA